ncbi:MAG: MogA/MoaB family molybdenum cofactor biosynthesis protein [Planctomycetota bacterium]
MNEMNENRCGCEPQAAPVRLGVITLSDTRTIETDRSGDQACELLRDSGHEIVERELIPDEPEKLIELIRRWVAEGRIDVIVTTGGTGIAARDQTIDAIEKLLDAELPGFGEHFRRLSFDEIGPSAMLSRALAGRWGKTAIFCLPGSTGAVRTGVSQCVLPILPHVVGLLAPTQEQKSV